MNELPELLTYLTPQERVELDRLLTAIPIWSYIDPHAAQRSILASTARFKVLACGRRWGKTILGIHVLGQSTLTTGLPHAYFAPTYKMLADVWREFKYALRDVTAVKNEQERRLELHGGGVLDFWSLDNPDAARGRKYAGIDVDEAAMVPDGGYVWNAVLRPLLTDYQGWALFKSTPRGHNWFWEVWLKGQDPLQPEWASWQLPTSTNPYIEPDEIEAARQDVPERTFEQEYLAEFTDDAGGVFRGVTAISTLAPDEPLPSHTYVFGVDWGRHYDYTAIAVIDRDTRRQVYLDRFTDIGWEIQRGRLKALAEKWRPVVIWAEENSMGGPNVEALQRDGLPVKGFNTTASSKGPLIEALALGIEQGQMRLLNNSVQKGELQAYEMQRLPSGTFRYSAPDGGHDDTVIALALAWHGVVHTAWAGTIRRGKHGRS